MVAIATKTKYSQIIDAINERLAVGKPVGEDDFFWFNARKKDAENLLKLDAAQGHIALAALWQLKWDEEQADYHMRCAITADPSIDTKTQAVTLQGNFGRFGKASALLKDVIDPRNGHFRNNYYSALSCGAFQALSENQKIAETMELDLSDLPIETVNKAAEILSVAGITDDQTALALDVLGEILREKKLFWGESVVIEVDDVADHKPTVFFTMEVHESPENTSRLTFDLYDRLVRKYPNHPGCFNLGFRSAASV